MPQILCPHCLEPVAMEEPSAAFLARCPVCAGSLDAADPEGAPSMEYGVTNPDENPHKSEEVQEYVHSLERRARRERKQEPYHRGRFPVDRVAGIVLMSGAVLLLLTAFTSDGGLMARFVNSILPAFVLMMLGGLCLRISAK